MTLDLIIPEQPAVELGHSQWRVETFQLVNWGGFQGRHEVSFSAGSSLISGASGVGKSTVLDAYLALMMPSDTPFNGASNDAGGRARSAEQRNLLTYLRGKTDKSRVEGSEVLHDQVLRGGGGQPTWGALAGTFINDDGRRYTVLRIYFVKAGATVGGDVTTTFATFEGYLDISRLEALAAARFDKRTLKTALPGLVTFNTFWEFEENIHTRLGIGGGDGGRKAMRLLARVQAGMQIKRVDGLYKSMVLEEPITYSVADDALEHFADLEAAYSKMTEEADKVKALHRLPPLLQEYADAEAKEMLIRQFGAETQGASPFRLWMHRTERVLLDAAVTENRRTHADTTTAYQRARVDEAEYERQLTRIGEDKRSHGGDAIDERLGEIASHRASRDGVYAANLKFQARTEAIDLVVPERFDEFAAAQAVATNFSTGFAERAAELAEAEEDVRAELSPLTALEIELLGEKKSLAGRAGMVPRRLHEARVRMAEAAGLDPMVDLPFAAELMDVLPSEAHWRKAVENTLGSMARTMLVDRDVRDRLSAAIDGVVIRPRINFQGVALTAHKEWRGNPDLVSGKLDFKDSPFSRWVQERVSNHSVDHLCVPDTASLGGREPRVTPSGQTRNGDRGAHGESGDGDIIGFSNERRLADIEQLLAALAPQIAAVRLRIKVVLDSRAALDRQREAHVFVQDTAWADIDFQGIDWRIGELEGEITRLRAANGILNALQTEEERIRPLMKQANRDKVLAKDRLGKLESRHGDLATAQDEAQTGVDEIVNAQTATVTEDQQLYLDNLFRRDWDASNVDTFAANMRSLRKRLSEDAEAARRNVRTASNAMENMFEAYKSRWTELNLGTTVASADGYRQILNRIQAEGLHERRDRWRREFAAWSSDDLLRLNDAFDTALEDIEDRLGPINRILETLPFGGKGTLQISLRRLQSAELSEFRRGLRELSSGLAQELSDQQVETRFKKLREFMTRLRVPEGHTKSSTSQRDRFLDVRQHVVITAVCLDENNLEIAVYDSLGDKSGGETQELVAFIVGSALRYQLGDESRSRPRFAPVFLDEGFVKSDSEFAGRAVKAWQDLGFQLVIGAPLDKVTGLEPHMDSLMIVTKNERGHSYVLRLANPTDPDLVAGVAA